MRLTYLRSFFLILVTLVILKLAFIQIVGHEKYTIEAENQHTANYKIPADRGEILSSDGFPLVTSQKAYLVYLSLKEFREQASASTSVDVSEKLAEEFWQFDKQQTQTKISLENTIGKNLAIPKEPEASAEASLTDQKKDELKKTAAEIVSKINNKDLVWVPLKNKVDQDFKTRVSALNIPGLGFQEISVRGYPEGNLLNPTLGFVGEDSAGGNHGYLGLEGYYNGEINGRAGFLRQEIDASGRPILVGENFNSPVLQGTTLLTTIDRNVQYIAEKKLSEGVRKYGAKGGTVVIMDPETGAIIASASRPSFSSQYWNLYDKADLVDPAIGATYEPGSTFKLITYSAGLDLNLITPETTCSCSGPLTLNSFTIQTWNNKYHPNSSIAEGLQNSDNIVTTFISQRLGNQELYKYIKRFGFGENTNVDLEGEEKGIINDPKNWQDIDLATASFGQGLTVTPLQMITAVAAIANNGQLVKPYVVSKATSLVGDSKRERQTKPVVVRQVIKSKTAEQMTEMMVRAVENGESKNFLPKGMRVAGKTGTAQIPVEGRYDPAHYTASFVGFAPVGKPKFVMLVKYDQPSASIYGSTTAAPTFFEIAKELYSYWGIPLEE